MKPPPKGADDLFDLFLATRDVGRVQKFARMNVFGHRAGRERRVTSDEAMVTGLGVH